MRKVEPKTMTKADRMHWRYGVDAIKMVEYELHDYLRKFDALPVEWHGIWEDDDRRGDKRTKVTANFDADVVKFFKGLGPGYQHRMNRVLRAFMHGRLAGVIKGAETMDYFRAPEAARPRWGAEQAALEELAGPELARAMGEEPGVPIGDETPSIAERLAEMRRRVQAQGTGPE